MSAYLLPERLRHPVNSLLKGKTRSLVSCLKHEGIAFSTLSARFSTRTTFFNPAQPADSINKGCSRST